ncbi:MAG: hypothetical protein WCT31_05870, partial [Candidatus Micrarchaeia archaeon]
INKEIANSVDFVIDMGETKYKKGSTVVDLVEMKVLRKGAGMFEGKNSGKEKQENSKRETNKKPKRK